MAEHAIRPPLIDTFLNASRGLADTWRHERSFRVQAGVGATALALSLWLGVGTVLVIAFGSVVLVLELINTALERLADVVHPGHHPQIGAAKDAAAAAVLVASLAALSAGLLVLGPPLLARLGGGG